MCRVFREIAGTPRPYPLLTLPRRIPLEFHHDRMLAAYQSAAFCVSAGNLLFVKVLALTGSKASWPRQDAHSLRHLRSQ